MLTSLGGMLCWPATGTLRSCSFAPHRARIDVDSGWNVDGFFMCSSSTGRPFPTSRVALYRAACTPSSSPAPDGFRPPPAGLTATGGGMAQDL